MHGIGAVFPLGTDFAYTLVSARASGTADRPGSLSRDFRKQLA
uniref:Uncharacterized protein n=1 Tax=uncultured bacterium contig00193 TaxID=1181606 RepID=A0A806KD18_9BACT|nr:hypothetical protein [uncultured bacterium contig00193]